MTKRTSRHTAGAGEQQDLFGTDSSAPAPPVRPPPAPEAAPAPESAPPAAEAPRKAAEEVLEGPGAAGAQEEGSVVAGGRGGGGPRPGLALRPGEELFLPGRAPQARPAAEAPGSVSARPARATLSVGELTRAIKGTLEGSFGRVLVRGEVTGFRGVHSRGHLFFALKDAEATIEVKVWASTASRLKFGLRDGMSLLVEGSIDVYAPQGRYSLVAQRLEPDGEGALALAFQQLKERLTAEGLMGPNRVRPPRPLPTLPRRIGVVTSVGGAALQDFLRVLHGRHPRLSVLVCDARVQGEGATDDVVRALRRLARTDVDVIVVTRGGGSVEDLWTFNEERVARAIAASPVPVVSAIGHEVDFTIADFVSDLRSATPSAAAERLAPVLAELEAGLKSAQVRLRQAAFRAVLEGRAEVGALRQRLPEPHRRLSQGRMQLTALSERLARAARGPLKTARGRQQALAERLDRQRPQARVAQGQAALGRLRERLERALRERLRAEGRRVATARLDLTSASPATRVSAGSHRVEGLERQLQEQLRLKVERERGRLVALAGRLEAMSPLRVLARGYSVTFRQADGALVRRAEDVQPGEALVIRLAGVDCREPADCEEVVATVTAVRPRRPPA